jgi:hypothetical protein
MFGLVPFDILWAVGQAARNKPSDVAAAQVLMNLADKPGVSGLPVDGRFGPATLEALLTFQRKVLGLSRVSLVLEPGSSTIRALITAAIPRARLLTQLPVGKPSRLSESDYQEAARQLDCEVAAVKAVAAVESAGDGFLGTGQPKILFEARIFSAQTGGRYDRLFPDISSAKFDRALYKGGAREYHRLMKAMLLDRTSALESASWGKFQILGINCKLAGHPDLNSFIRAMHRSERAQLDAFCAFVTSRRLVKSLQTHDWAAFAFGYNGKGYREKHYDRRIKEEFEKASARAASR